MTKTKLLKQKTNATSKIPPVPITCTFSRPGKKASATGKNLAASLTLLTRRRHFLLHQHHLPSRAVFPWPQGTPLGLRQEPRSQARAPDSRPEPLGSDFAMLPDVTARSPPLASRSNRYRPLTPQNPASVAETASFPGS